MMYIRTRKVVHDSFLKNAYSQGKKYFKNNQSRGGSNAGKKVGAV